MELKPGLVGKHKFSCNISRTWLCKQEYHTYLVNGTYARCGPESRVSLFRISLKKKKKKRKPRALGLPLWIPLSYFFVNQERSGASPSPTLIHRTGLHNRRYWGERFGKWQRKSKTRSGKVDGVADVNPIDRSIKRSWQIFWTKDDPDRKQTLTESITKKNTNQMLCGISLCCCPQNTQGSLRSVWFGVSRLNMGLCHSRTRSG